MPVRRYLVESVVGDEVRLVGDEAHHLLHVHRAGLGDAIVLFDGHGWEYRGVVTRRLRREAVIAIVGRAAVDREPAVDVILGVALPKGDRQRILVEKAVELGVQRLTPLVVARGVALASPKALARLRRTVAEASKQCGRNRLMEIGAATTWDGYLLLPDRLDARYVAHPAGAGPSRPPVNSPAGTAARRPNDRRSRVWLAVGPEGGLTEEEIDAAARLGWVTVDLGRRVLRVETAALCLAVLAIYPGLGESDPATAGG